MSNPVIFQQDGRTYKVFGLAEQAASTSKASAEMGIIISERVRAAKAALERWEGPHAKRFIEQANALLETMARFKTALWHASIQLSAFPVPLSQVGVGSYGVPAPKVAPVRPVTPGRAGAEPQKLRHYGNVASGQDSRFSALAGTVTLEGVTATVTAPRPKRYSHLPSEPDAIRGEETLHFSPSKLITLPDVASLVRPLVAESHSLSRFTAAVASALTQLDRSGQGLRSTTDMSMLDALVKSRLANPTAAEQNVWDKALDALAGEYAERLHKLGRDDFSEASWTPEMAAQHPELRDLLADIKQRSERDPKFAARLIEHLGADGVHRVLNRLRVQATSLSYSPARGASVEKDLLIPFAEVLAIAARPGGTKQGVLDGIAAGDPNKPGMLINTALLLAVAKFDRRFLEPAFRATYRVLPLGLETLASEVMGGDIRVGALKGLSRNPDLAWNLVSTDKDLRESLLIDRFHDKSRAAGDVLFAALHQHVHSYQKDLQRSKEVFADIVRLVSDGKNLQPGSRIALARISTLHLEDISLSAGHGSMGGGPIQSMKREELVRFFKDVLEESESQEILAKGLGVYSAVLFNQGAQKSAAKGGDPTRFNDSVIWAGQLFALLGEAAELKIEDRGQRTTFLMKAGEAMASTLISLGLAATGVGAPISIPAGAGSSFLISQLMEKIPMPTFNQDAEKEDLHRMLYVVAARAIVTYKENFRDWHPPLSAADRSRLRDPEFVSAVIKGDRAKEEEFNRILERNSDLAADVLEAQDQAWVPIDEHLGKRPG